MISLFGRSRPRAAATQRSSTCSDVVMLCRPSSVISSVQWGQCRTIHRIGDPMSKRNPSRPSSIRQPDTSAPVNLSRDKETSNKASVPGPEVSPGGPETSAALAVLGLAAMPADRRELDLQVSRLAGAGWTWEMTGAWRHLWLLLPPKATPVEHGGEVVTHERAKKPGRRRP